MSYLLAETRPRRYKCGLSAPCPAKHLAFRLVSGAANVIGPKICLEDKMWDSYYFISIYLCLCLPCCLSSFFFFFFLGFTHCSFSPLCCHNQASKPVWGAECKYSFSRSVPHAFVFVSSPGSSYIGCCSSSARQCVHVCRWMFMYKTSVLLKWLS